MRTGLRGTVTAAFAVVLLAGWRPATEPEVEIVEATLKTYAVTGTTPERIRESMKENGPYFWHRRATARAAAELNLDWDYREEKVEDGCRIRAFKVVVRVGLVMPEWRDRADARPEAQASWDRLYADLLRHERGHHAIAVEAGNELARRIRALGAFPDCASISPAIGRLRLQVRGKYDFVHRDYDEAEARRASPALSR